MNRLRDLRDTEDTEAEGPLPGSRMHTENIKIIRVPSFLIIYRLQYNCSADNIGLTNRNYFDIIAVLLMVEQKRWATTHNILKRSA